MFTYVHIYIYFMHTHTHTCTNVHPQQLKCKPFCNCSGGLGPIPLGLLAVAFSIQPFYKVRARTKLKTRRMTCFILTNSRERATTAP